MIHTVESNQRNMRSRRRKSVFALTLALAATSAAAVEVPVDSAATQRAVNEADPLLVLNFPANSPLSVLISYVSERRQINLIYDEATANQQFTLRAPMPVRLSNLEELLSNVLQSKGLILEDTDVPGVKRIASATTTSTTPQVQQGDKPVAAGGQMVTRFYPLKQVRPEQLMPLVVPMLSKPSGRVVPLADKQALVVTDYAVNTRRIAEFIEVVDRSGDASVLRTVPVRHGNARQMAQSLQQLMQAVGKGAGNGTQSVAIVADDSTGQLMISAPKEQADQLSDLVSKMDMPHQVQQETRFHKLTNTVASEVLETLRALDGQSKAGTTKGSASRNTSGSAQGGIPAFGTPLASNSRPTEADSRLASSQIPSVNGGTENNQENRPVIAADENTNSIIIIGTSAQQELYKPIIQKLDQRRPQVMIETTVIELDTSDNFSLGVDLGLNQDNGRIISFSSFGVSSVTPGTGKLTPVAAPGGTMALLNPDIASIVVHALAGNSRSRLVSMPRILVNDNSTGKLGSVNQRPFSRIVVTNGSTISGEGDTAEAGTVIEVVPHISNGDYLQLEYSVELSSFDESATVQTNLPPPSQRNTVSSKVTVPDGHTIVVGGLNRSNSGETINSVPVLGQIPGLEYLFSSRKKNNSNTTLFVFIRPSILRDDQFSDLKYISALDRKLANVADDLPKSEPLAITPKR